jgi:ubiquitin-protein ligase E3 C
LKSLDYELYKQLNFIRNYSDGPVEDMGLFFTTVDENPLTGTTEDIELVPGGSELAVTDQNKFRYIYMVADYKLNRRIKRQSDAFISGFHECISLNWLHIFEES